MSPPIHDMDIANGTGSAVRADINGALAALVALSSNSSEPSTKYAYMFWADTTNNVLKQRNAANNAWITIFSLGVANGGLATAASPTLTGNVTMSGNGFLLVPSGTNAQQPGQSGQPAAANGQFRYNTNSNEFEGYADGAWGAIGGAGGGATGGDGGANAVFWENQLAVTHDYTITAARGAGSFGEITINSGKTVTIPAGSSWTIVG